MKKLFSMFVAAVMMFTMAGCASGEAAKDTSKDTAAEAPKETPKETTETKAEEKKTLQTIKVGFSQMENNGPWRIAETNSVKGEAEKRGVQLVYTDAQSDTAKQVSDVEDLIAQGVDYIVLAPREYEGLAPALESAKEAGIPVILIDREAKGEYLTLVVSDFIWEGQQAGALLAEKTGGKANIVELSGTAGSSVAIDRANGFAETIKKYPDMKIISSQSADFSRAEGQKVMENIIQAKGKEITAVYAHNDEMAIGAIQALKAAGMTPGKDVTVISIDGQKDALTSIISGDLFASIECSPFFGPMAFDIIEKHLAGGAIEKKIINEDRIFTSENAEEFVDSAY
ncbi:MAG: periplasmic binding protein/LacI transcriptional regulator [Clostridia bacterium]|jgi:ribose transport system substrate-binding protein|nr:periplasmic binding protein/LacI transcriptional regulator [Clostridia bacterium]